MTQTIHLSKSEQRALDSRSSGDWVSTTVCHDGHPAFRSRVATLRKKGYNIEDECRGKAENGSTLWVYRWDLKHPVKQPEPQEWHAIRRDEVAVEAQQSLL